MHIIKCIYSLSLVTVVYLYGRFGKVFFFMWLVRLVCSGKMLLLLDCWQCCTSFRKKEGKECYVFSSMNFAKVGKIAHSPKRESKKKLNLSLYCFCLTVSFFIMNFYLFFVDERKHSFLSASHASASASTDAEASSAATTFSVAMWYRGTAGICARWPTSARLSKGKTRLSTWTPS